MGDTMLNGRAYTSQWWLSKSFDQACGFDLDPGAGSPARQIAAGKPLGHDALKFLTDDVLIK